MDLIGDLLRREGGYVHNPEDKGGETKFGISKRAFPTLDIKNLTEAQARAIYEQKYIAAPGFDQLAPSPLQTQLIDFGVNSGPAIAIQKLQEILGVAVDGVLGPQTLEVLRGQEVRAVNNKLVASRLKMMANLVAKRPAQVQFLRGWVNRALEFLIP